MIDYNKFKDTLVNLPKDKEVILCGHENTDYDSICSTLSLTKALKKLGYNSKMLLSKKDFSKLEWIDDHSEVIDEYDSDDYSFVMMDMNRKSRLGEFEYLFDRASITLNIDHHEKNKGESQYIFIEEEISSTCEIIYNVLNLFDDIIDFDIASLLYGGIVSDTYCFLQRTTSNTLNAASNLLKYGIDSKKIVKEVYLDKTMEEVEVLGNMISNLKYNRFHYIIMDRHNELYKDKDYNIMFKKCVSTIQNIKGVELLVMLLIELDGKVSGEIRSNTNLEVADLAIKLGGGGHKYAAGFTTDKSVDEIFSIINDYIEERV